MIKAEKSKILFIITDFAFIKHKLLRIYTKPLAYKLLKIFYMLSFSSLGL